VGVTVAQSRRDDSKDAVAIAKHFMIPETDHPIPFIFDSCGTRSIRLGCVLPAVHLDDELRAVTGKIRNEVPDGHLATEIPVGESLAKQTPHCPLGIGHVSPKTPCPIDRFRRWMMFQGYRSTTNITPTQPSPIQGEG